MATIAQTMGVSRSTVSRLLTRARDEGLVEIRIASSQAHLAELESRIAERYGVSPRVVGVPEKALPDERYALTAAAGASLVADLMGSDATLAIAWGTMVNAISHHLPPKPCANARIVAVDGMGQATSGIHYSFGALERFSVAFDAFVQQFLFPIFVDSPQTKEMFERERLLGHIRSLTKSADILLFNPGTVHEGVPSQAYLRGYFLGEDEFAELRADGAVGDIATTFVDASGCSDNIRLNSRTTGRDLEIIRNINRRICVSCGIGKIHVFYAALSGGLITDLVVDELTAEAILRLPPVAE